MKRLLVCLFILGFLVACSSTPQQSKEPQQVLTDFLGYLASKEYQKADALYGGPYDVLIDMAPRLDPNNHAALWENACQVSGFQCLTIRSIVLAGQTDEIFSFNVQFSNRDGTLFVLGPCCGADETEMPPTSEFAYRVQETLPGKYLVLDRPVYVP